MSEDESPMGGQQPSTDYDPNSSIIGKVRSRVSSILPQTLTKWFSPTTTDSSQNGNIRRRRDRDDVLDRDADDSQNTDDSDMGEEEEEENVAPPLKRVRLNPEEHTITETYQTRNQNVNSHFLSSTPTVAENRRSNLNISRNQRELSCNFESATTSTLTTSRLGAAQTTCVNDESTDVTDRPQRYREMEWNDSRKISSRRSLNIPASSTVTRRLPDLRRQSLKKIRTNLDSPRSSIAEQDLEEEQEPDVSDAEGKTGHVSVVASNAGKVDNSPLLLNGVGESSNIVVQVDDAASESGESQCSSLQRPPKHPRTLITAPKMLRTSMGNGLNFYTHLEGKKSLFSDKNISNILHNSTTSLTSLNRRQSFNASLYGSTSALSDSRILNTASPFYKGRTTYGGASAYNKYSQNAQRALRTPTLIRPTSSLSTLSSSNNSLAQCSDASPAISNTAKRILELMNQFTSPLADAKKMANNIKVPALIAHKKRFGESDLVASRAIRMTTPKTPYSRPSSSKVRDAKDLGPPTSELQVPSMSQLLQMKKLQNNTERVREIANSSKSILNREEEYILPTGIQSTDNGSSKHVSKIKNKVSSTRLSKKTILEEQEQLPAVNLPDIPLPFMKSVPKIDIPLSSGTAAPTSTLSKNKTTFSATSNSSSGFLDGSKSNGTASLTTISRGTALSSSGIGSQKKMATPSIQAASLASNKNEIVNTQLSGHGVQFKFSSPIPVETTLKTNIEPINNFKFSAPVPISSSPRKDNFKYQPQRKSSLQDGSKPAESSVSINKTSTPPLKSGSVLDILKKPAEVTKAENKPLPSLADQFKASNKWECSVCMIRNDDSRDKCEACETPKKKTAGQAAVNQTKPALGAPSTSTFGAAFKPKSDTWECPICMVRNKNDDAKCIACSANKPGGSVPSTSSTVPKTTDASFKNIVAEQSSKWECSVCMTRNEQNRTKCICCEQVRPGAVSDNAPKFSFGTSGSKFTFGFAAQKEDDIKKNEESKDKTAAASATKPETKEPATEKGKGSGFTFGTTSALPMAGTPASSITFGLKPAAVTVSQGKDVTDTTSGGFKFGAAVQTKEKEEPKPALVFGSKIGTPSKDNKVENNDKQPTGGFKFGSANPMTPATPAKTIPNNDQKNNQQVSAFKPVGGFTFGSVSSKTVEVTKATTESLTKPATFGFGSGSAAITATTEANKAVNKINESSTSQKPDSTAEVKTSFKFGTTPESKGVDEKKANFSFGSSSSSTVFPAFGSETPKIEKPSTGLFTAAQVTSSAPMTPASSSFVFGKPAAATTSATPLFGAVSSSTVTAGSSAVTTSSTPSFGSIATSAVNASLFGSAANSPLMTSRPAFGSSPQQQTATAFGTSFSASTSNAPQDNSNKQATNLFTFGAASKSDLNPNKTVFGSVSSTSKPFPIGANNNTPATLSAAPFVFGSSAQKPAEPAPVFGSVSSNTGNAAVAAPLPGFGSFSSTMNTQQPQGSTFGQAAASNTTPFGSSNPPPAFGSTPAASGSIFGSSTPSFGTPAPPPAFGATNSTFGSSTAATPTFGTGFSTDGPAAKKSEPAFNFGSSTQQNSTGAFQFGGSNNNNNNNNNSKPAFNFSATTPSFNFTAGSQETAPNAPFQFNAAPAANNPFAPMPTPGTPSSQAGRRKIRTATRRTQPRQANS